MVLKTKNSLSRRKYGETSGTSGTIRIHGFLIRSQTLWKLILITTNRLHFYKDYFVSVRALPPSF